MKVTAHSRIVYSVWRCNAIETQCRKFHKVPMFQRHFPEVTTRFRHLSNGRAVDRTQIGYGFGRQGRAHMLSWARSGRLVKVSSVVPPPPSALDHLYAAPRAAASVCDGLAVLAPKVFVGSNLCGTRYAGNTPSTRHSATRDSRRTDCGGEVGKSSLPAVPRELPLNRLHATPRKAPCHCRPSGAAGPGTVFLYGQV